MCDKVGGLGLGLGLRNPGENSRHTSDVFATVMISDRARVRFRYILR